MKDSRPNLKPGKAEPFREGRRYRRHLNGKLVVDARAWSSLTNNWVPATFDSVTDAKDWQSSQRTGRVHGQEIDPKRAKLSFAAIAAEWLARNPDKEVGSRSTDRYRLAGTGVKFAIQGEGKEVVVTIIEGPTDFAAMRVGGIHTSDVEDLVNGWKAEDYKPSYIRGMYRAVCSVFRYAVNSKAIPRGSSPCEEIEPSKLLPKVPEVSRPVLRPDDADLDEFVGVLSLGNDDLIRLAYALGPNYSLVVWIAVYLGTRWQEVVALKVSSLDLLQGQIKIEQAMNRQQQLKGPKTDAGKRFFVDRDLAPEISAHLARRGLTAANGDAFLFINHRDRKPLTYDSWRNTWMNALRKAGLDWKKPDGHYLGLHDLRSMNASIMDDEGVGSATQMYRRGHSDGQDGDPMGRRYRRTSPRQNREASEKIHAVLRRVPNDSAGGNEGETGDRPVIDTRFL